MVKSGSKYTYSCQVRVWGHWVFGLIELLFQIYWTQMCFIVKAGISAMHQKVSPYGSIPAAVVVVLLFGVWADEHRRSYTETGSNSLIKTERFNIVNITFVNDLFLLRWIFLLENVKYTFCYCCWVINIVQPPTHTDSSLLLWYIYVCSGGMYKYIKYCHFRYLFCT